MPVADYEWSAAGTDETTLCAVTRFYMTGGILLIVMLWCPAGCTAWKAMAAALVLAEHEGDVCRVVAIEGIHGTRRAAELIGAPLGTAGPLAPAASAHRRIRV